MSLAEMIAALRVDLGDSGSLFTEAALERCLRRAVIIVAHDASISLEFDDDGELAPAPTGLITEAIALMAQVSACEQMRARTANTPKSISIDDQRVDRGDQAGIWAELERSLREQYWALIRRVNSAADQDIFLAVPPTRAVVYERGVEIDDGLVTGVTRLPTGEVWPR
jgi:hypothetical protein